MPKNWSLEETLLSYDQKFICSDKSGKNSWNKVKKSSKIGQDYRTLISTFAYFLTAIAKV